MAIIFTNNFFHSILSRRTIRFTCSNLYDMCIRMDVQYSISQILEVFLNVTVSHDRDTTCSISSPSLLPQNGDGDIHPEYGSKRFDDICCS